MAGPTGMRVPRKTAAKDRKRKRAPDGGLSPEKLRFCEVYALNGNNGADAVAKSFKAWAKKDSQARCVKASKLLGDGKILARIESLQHENARIVESKYRLSASNILEELGKIASSNLSDFLTITPSGMPKWDFKRAGRDQWAAVQAIEMEPIFPADDDDDDGSGAPAAPSEGGEPSPPEALPIGVKVKLKFHDKKGALVDLGKNCGLWKEPKQETHVHVHLPDRLRAAIERKRAARQAPSRPVKDTA